MALGQWHPIRAAQVVAVVAAGVMASFAVDGIAAPVDAGASAEAGAAAATAASTAAAAPTAESVAPVAATGAGNIELPEKVAKAFKSQFPRGSIAKAERETEHGVEVFDLEFKEGGVERECDIASDGTILNTSIVVDAALVPEAPMKSLTKTADGGAIKRIEKSEIYAETRSGKITRLAKARIEYEAEIEKGGRYGEVTVAADGALVEGLKWGTEDPEDQ